jgi:hypothetical protein
VNRDAAEALNKAAGSLTVPTLLVGSQRRDRIHRGIVAVRARCRGISAHEAPERSPALAYPPPAPPAPAAAAPPAAPEAGAAK